MTSNPFPLPEFEHGLQAMHSSLEDAKSFFNDDDEMLYYINQAQSGLSSILCRLQQYPSQATEYLNAFLEQKRREEE